MCIRDSLEKSTEAINRLATSVEVMAKEQKHQTEAIKEVKTDLSDLSGNCLLYTSRCV